MDLSALTRGLLVVHPSLPNPFWKTAKPLRPTTTEAPGYPPALIPRATIRSMDASRVADMPTDFGVLTGNPSDAASETHAPRRMWTTSQLRANGDAVAHDRGRPDRTRPNQTEPSYAIKPSPVNDER